MSIRNETAIARGATVSTADGSLDQAVEYMTGFIRRDVAAGFEPPARIVETAVELGTDEGVDPETLRPVARRLTREALAEHYRAQVGWPDRTDCDRLDEAFAELEVQGIVARQNFTCCSTCGHYEIGAEVVAARKRRPVTGYAFYHMQDTERAVEGGGVYVKYDALSDDRARKAEVGRRIVAAVEQAGLRAEWDGDPDTAVLVKLKWQKRRPIEASGEEPSGPTLFDGFE
jgi:hypothetical protein